MNKKLKVAVIGAGNMGKNHIRVYSSIANLVAIADPVEQVGKKVARKYKAKYYKNFEDMIANEKIDAVSVVVPTSLHKLIATICLKHQIPTIVEKPIANNVTDAFDMLKLAKKNNTLLMVGHIERFNPAVIKLRDLVKQGKLGKIISLNALRVGINPPLSANSDVVLDLAIHDIDIFNYLLNETPKNISLLKSKIYDMNISDSAALLLAYSSAKGIIQTNWVTPIKMRKLYVTGTSGYVELDYITQKLEIYKKNVTKKVYISKKEPLKEELIYFLDCVRRKRKIDSTHALEALKIALDNESIRP